MKQKQELTLHDPLWDMTPDLGVEALIATIEDHSELVKALTKVNEDNKRKKINL